MVFVAIVMTANAQRIEKQIFVTPENFGCVADKEMAAEKNTIAFQKAIEYAEKSGKKLISTGGKKYYISKSLRISSPISVDLNHATLIATDSINMIVVDGGTPLAWAGEIKGVRLDLNNKARIGLNCNNAIKIHISDCEIVNVPQNAVAINIKEGYEVFVDNIHIRGGENRAIGFKIRTCDCHFSDCVVINCQTAVDCIGSNFFERIHAWMTSEWLERSTFFRIGGGGPIYLHQCFSDTFDHAFDIDGKTILYVSQQKNYHNKKMWNIPSGLIHPEFFHFVNESVSKESNIILENSYIDGLIIDNQNKQKFSNIKNASVTVTNSYINY